MKTTTVCSAFTAITLSLGLLVPCASASFLLYDAAAGGSPLSQGRLAYVGADRSTLAFGTYYTTASEGTTLDTTVRNAVYSGFSNRAYGINPFSSSLVIPGAFVDPDFPALDPVKGYTVSVTFRINSQVNDGTNGPDRAGFSLTVIGDDLKGLEVGFREDEIFTQSLATGSFKAADVTSVDSDILGSLTTWELSVKGTGYSLMAGGNTILTGTTRSYATATGLGSAAYATANGIYLGDNTTSARASVTISRIAVTVVPEPATWAAMAGCAALGLVILRRRRRG